MSLPIVSSTSTAMPSAAPGCCAELRQIDMPSERFPAVWWADVPPEQASRWYSDDLNAREYYKPLRNGGKGLLASHIGAWQQLLASEAPALVVLEDDVRLTPQFADVVNAIAALQEPWDMVKLLGRDREKVRSQRPLVPGTALSGVQPCARHDGGLCGQPRRCRQALGAPPAFWQAHRSGPALLVGMRSAAHPGRLALAIALDDTSEVSSIWDTRDTLTPASAGASSR